MIRLYVDAWKELNPDQVIQIHRTGWMTPLACAYRDGFMINHGLNCLTHLSAIQQDTDNNILIFEYLLPSYRPFNSPCTSLVQNLKGQQQHSKAPAICKPFACRPARALSTTSDL